MKWIKIESELPKLNQIVIVFNKQYIQLGFITDIYLDRFHQGETDWVNEEYMDLRDVTHWMPLPNPPKN